MAPINALLTKERSLDSGKEQWPTSHPQPITKLEGMGRECQVAIALLLDTPTGRVGSDPIPVVTRGPERRPCLRR